MNPYFADLSCIFWDFTNKKCTKNKKECFMCDLYKSEVDVKKEEK